MCISRICTTIRKEAEAPLKYERKEERNSYAKKMKESSDEKKELEKKKKEKNKRQSANTSCRSPDERT